MKNTAQVTWYSPKLASAPETLLSSENMLSEKYRASYSVYAQVSERARKPFSHKSSHVLKIKRAIYSLFTQISRAHPENHSHT